MPDQNSHNGNSRPSPADMARAYQKNTLDSELDHGGTTPEDSHDEEGEQSPDILALEELVRANTELNGKVAELEKRLKQLEDERNTQHFLRFDDIDAIIDRMNERHGKKSAVDETTDDNETKGNPTEETLTLADDQPRRVRNQGSVTEQLVKYIDSKGDTVYKWRSPDGEETAADESPANAPDDSGERGDDAEPELSLARHAYAEATAKRRGGVLGNLLTDPNNTLQYLPFVKKWAEKRNDKVDAKTLAPQREAYREATKAEQKKVYDAAIAELGDTEEGRNEARSRAIRAALQNDYLLEVEIASRRMENSGTAGRFINWWVRGNPESKLRTFFRRAGKASVLAAGGFTAGTLLAVGGVPLGAALAGGAVVGGIIGGGIGNRISKRRASGFEDKSETGRIADIQAKEDIEYKQKDIDELDKDKSYTDATDALIGITEGRTGDEETGNRRRVGTGVGVGLAAGGAGAAAGAVLRMGIENAVPQDHSGKSGSGDHAGKDKDLYGKVPTPADTAPIPPPEVAPQLPGIGGYEYPWDWARDAFGANDASTRLHELGQLAQNSGHSVDWYTTVDGSQAIRVDGNDSTNYVLGVLDKLTNQLKP